MNVAVLQMNKNDKERFITETFVLQRIHGKGNISMSINTNIKDILLLVGYYGQISSIGITIGENDNKIEYDFLPISIRNENIVYYFKKRIKKDYHLKDNIQKIIIINKNLVNINYIHFQKYYHCR